MKAKIFRTLAEYVTILWVAAVAFPAFVQADTGCTGTKDAVMAALLKATNATRSSARSCGSIKYSAAAPVKWNDSLVEAARNHSKDMAYNNFFSHTGSDGRTSANRVRALGYAYRAVGENIAAGRGVVSDAHAASVKSAGHCRNIMNSTFDEMGAACISNPNSKYKRYWTVVFGKHQS